jgi:hypothetical protein
MESPLPPPVRVIRLLRGETLTITRRAEDGGQTDFLLVCESGSCRIEIPEEFYQKSMSNDGSRAPRSGRDGAA